MGDRIDNRLMLRGPMATEPLQRLRSEILALPEAERAEFRSRMQAKLETR
jgi:hypothetical protein